MADDYEARDEAREQREHELEMKRLDLPQKSEWPITIRVVLVWALIVAGICYLSFIGKIG